MKTASAPTSAAARPRTAKSPGHRGRNTSAPQGAQKSQNAQRNYERYLALARAEALGGDQIVAENYFQHAEHYFRAMREASVPQASTPQASH